MRARGSPIKAPAVGFYDKIIISIADSPLPPTYIYKEFLELALINKFFISNLSN